MQRTEQKKRLALDAIRMHCVEAFATCDPTTVALIYTEMADQRALELGDTGRSTQQKLMFIIESHGQKLMTMTLVKVVELYRKDTFGHRLGNARLAGATDDEISEVYRLAIEGDTITERVREQVAKLLGFKIPDAQKSS